MAAPQEWSGTFARARAEMFTAALLFSAITFWELDLKHIPLLGLQASVAPPRGLLLLFILAFFVYAVVSTIMRWLVENNSIASPIDPYDDVLSKLEALRDTLVATDVAAQAGILKNGADAMLETLERGGLGKGQGGAILASLQRVEAINQALSVQELTEIAARSISAQPGSLAVFSDQTKSELAQRIASEFVSGRESIRQETETLQALARVVEGARETLKLQATEFKEAIVETVAKLTSLQEKQNTELTDRISLAEKAITAIRRRVYGLRSIEAFERNALSFYLPVGTSLVIVVMSLNNAFDLMLSAVGLK